MVWEMYGFEILRQKEARRSVEMTEVRRERNPDRIVQMKPEIDII